MAREQRLRTIFRLLLIIGVISEITVLIFAGMSPAFSYLWALFPLLFISTALTLLFAGMIMDRRREGSWPVSLDKTAERFGVPRKALVLLVSEINSLWSLTKVFHQSQPTTPGYGEAHPGYRNLRIVVYVILGLVTIETAIVHIAVSSQFWRVLLLIVSVYALLLLFGFYTSIRTNPHLLTSQGVQLRHGGRFACEIPWENLMNAKKVGPGHGGDIVISKDGEARLPVLSEVNVRFEMESPVFAEDLHHGRMSVASIEIYCDDHKALLDSITQMRQLHGA